MTLMAYNEMYAYYCVRVEWDIGWLKHKFWRYMKQFDATKPKYNHLFWLVAILMNFIH